MNSVFVGDEVIENIACALPRTVFKRFFSIRSYNAESFNVRRVYPYISDNADSGHQGISCCCNRHFISSLRGFHRFRSHGSAASQELS